MKAKPITAILVLIGLFVSANKSYACPPPNQKPVAILTVDPVYAMTDVNVTLDGSASYDSDGSIVMCEWDWDHDPNVGFQPDYNETPGDRIAIHSYDTPGIYKVQLRVTDDDGAKDLSSVKKVYVNIKISVPNDVNTIQGAIDVSTNGSTITVSPDTYYENINFNSNKITVTSIDPNDPEIVAATIIDGNNINSVVKFDSGDAASTLKGFTITGGNATDGGGIYCSGVSPKIRNCTIVENDASDEGGGIYCNGASPTVTNCTIKSNESKYGGGIDCDNASPTISNCLITDNSANFGGAGMHNEGGSNPTLTNCIFTDNETSQALGGGMYNNSSSPSVINCLFIENSALSFMPNQGGGGIYNDSSSPSVINCTFIRNHTECRGGGMANYSSSSEPNITNCIFWDNTADDDGNEIYNYGSAEPYVSYCDIEGGLEGCGGNDCNNGGGNIYQEPNFLDINDPNGPDDLFRTFDDGLRLRTTSPCIDAGDPNTDSNDVGTVDVGGDNRLMDGDHDGNTVIDMGAYELPRIWYVDANIQDGNGFSWATAYDDLQDALTGANDGDEIWVAKGTYEPNDSNDRSASFQLVKSTDVYGGFVGTEVIRYQRDWVANKTTLSGDINVPGDQNDNSYHVVKAANDTELDGFTIKGGNASGTGADSLGGGIYCDGNSLTIRRCEILENWADSNGGGIYCNDSNATVENCIFTKNKAGGKGGGMFNNTCSLIFTNCVFRENDANSGGGLYNSDSSPTVINCVFHDNFAVDNGGGMYNNSCSPIITNCVFSENDANAGGGLYNSNSSPTATNCTLSKNSATYAGGGMCTYGASSNSIITNSIFWGNDANGYGSQMAFGGGPVSVDYSCIQDYNDDPNQDLVSHWKFDDGSGTTAVDSVGDNNGILNNGPNWVAGMVGSNSLDFDGSDDYVEVNDPPDGSLDFGDANFSISLWFKTTDTDGELVDKSGGNKGRQTGYSVYMGTYSTINDGEMGFRLADGTNRDLVKTNNAYNDGNWHHLVAVRTGSGSANLNIYVDGVDVPTSSVLNYGAGDINNPYNLSIGAKFDAGDTNTWENFFTGTIDDVRIYDRALTAEEIWQLYLINAGEGNIDSDPLFIDPNNPPGLDDVFGTRDDGLRLDPNGSPCIDAADGNSTPLLDILGYEREDINDVNNTGIGDPNYADIGAYETLSTDVVSGVYNVTDSNYYQTIQEAINEASNGDVIRAAEGKYYESISFIGKEIRLTSTDPNDPNVVSATIIDGNNCENRVVGFESSADSTIKGFTIRNGYRGIRCNSSSPTIANCIIKDSTLFDGVFFESNSSAKIIDCTITNNNEYGISCSSSNVIISHCNVSNNGSGIKCASSDAEISDCVVRDNAGWYGIYVDDSSPVIKRCEIINSNNTGILCSSSSSVTITNCVVADHPHKGIFCQGDSSATITNCTIVGISGEGVRKTSGSSVEVKNCILWDNDDDLDLCSATYSCIKDGDFGMGNFCKDPCFVDANNNDYHLKACTTEWMCWSPCIDTGDPTSGYSNEPNGGGGRINIGAYGNTDEAAVVTLADEDEDGLADLWELKYWPNDDPNQHDPNDDSDGDGLLNIVEYQIQWDPNTDESNSIPGYVLNNTTNRKYPGIQLAINQASHGDTLIADPGRYEEIIQFHGKKIAVTSTDPNDPSIVSNTIIDGQYSGDVVGFIHSEDANAVLKGFTITGGIRGIYCSGASPTVSNCIITDSEITGGNGAGLCCINSAHPTVTNCVFVKNSAKLGFFPVGTGLGGGIYCEDSNPLIRNCIIVENEAFDGAGIYDHNSSPLLINCTFNGNHAAGDGGGMYNDGYSGPIVANCIFWGNDANSDSNELYNSNGADPNFRHCDIRDSGGSESWVWDPNWDDGNNIDSDPNFRDVNDPAGLDDVFCTWDDGLRIMAYSPCVDAADSTFVGYLPNDIAGEGRADVPYANNADPNYADIGAYESRAVWFVDANATGNNNGQSWKNAFEHLWSSLEQANSGDEIWVAEGTYEPNDGNDRSISFELVEGATLYGGFSSSGHSYEWMVHETILSGDINVPDDQNDNSYHVVKGADGAVLDGFTIKGGNASSTGADSLGGGIYCDGNSLTVRRCVIFDNWADSNGGGIYSNDCNLILTNCIISKNKANNNGGGIFSKDSDVVTLTNCTITRNQSDYGGGIYDSNSDIEVRNSILWYNTATASGDSGDNIYNSSSYPTLAYCNMQGGLGACGGGDCNDGYGNISGKPDFNDVNDPAGLDGIFGTWDDGLRLNSDSPCIDAADGNAAPAADIVGFRRFDVSTIDNTGTGDPNYADMGVYESYFGGDSDGDGMQDVWEILYDLDPSDPTDAHEDPDDDGFDNLLEFLHETNPRDWYSKPSITPESLPYQTSFEWYQGFYRGNLHCQKNWEVKEGEAGIYRYWRFLYVDPYWYSIPYYYLGVQPNSVVTADFNDTGSDHDYIRFKVAPARDAEVRILHGENVVAAFKFEDDDWYTYVWDETGYKKSNTAEERRWIEMKLEMDFGTDTYNVYSDGNCIYPSGAKFGTSCDSLTTVEIKTGPKQGLVMDSISITGESSDDLRIDITNPCACRTDELEGKIPVEGTIWWRYLAGYEIIYCPVDPDIDRYDRDNWHVADFDTSIVDDGLLGYWDTSLIPNGYYYLGVIAYDDHYLLPHPSSPTVAYANDRPAIFAVVGDLKSNTFYHEEEPDITVSWPGLFPFELKRRYNNNRRFYDKPFAYGWTQNNQMTITEIATLDNCDQGSYGPAFDSRLLGFGEILVTYPDGSTRVFEHTAGDEGGSATVTYYPKLDTGTGEKIKRTTCCYNWDLDFLSFTVEDIDYELILSDGTVIKFDNANYFERLTENGWEYKTKITVPEDSSNGGEVWWKAYGGVKSMTDRFGNTLSFGWDYDNSRPTAVTGIKYQRPDDANSIGIVFGLDDPNDCYTKAELRVGDVYSSNPDDYDVYRTVYYEWDDVNSIFGVVKEGYGVDANGDYNSVDIKQYVTQYQYEYISGGGLNLTKIAYGDDINNPSIEVEYDDYGRVALRKDYVDPCNFLPTDFNYILDDSSNLQTDANTPYRFIRTIQDNHGALLEQRTFTSDGSAVTDVNMAYNGTNPLKPTDINEYFDGFVRKTWNDYNTPGYDLTEQRIYIDDTNYVATEIAYHTVSTGGKYCVFKSKETRYQGLSETGKKVQIRYIYGHADGDPNSDDGIYLVEEKILLAGDPCDANAVWADTKYKYDPNTGLVKEKVDPNNFRTAYYYDANNYSKFIKVGPEGSEEPVQRFYYDEIGQLRLKANHLGGVTLNDYDDFGRLWKIRTYYDPNALTTPDANFAPDVNNTYMGMDPCSITIYGYDARGNRTYEKRPAGGKIITDYTTSGLTSKVTNVNDVDSYIEYTYNSRGLNTWEHKYDAITDVNAYVEFAYDSMDRLADTWWHDYDSNSVVKHEASKYYGSGKKKYDKLYSDSNQPEKQTNYNYDILGRPTDIIVAPNDFDLTTSYNYDAAGNRTSIIDPNDNIIYFDYDNANRKTREYFTAASGTAKSNATVKKQIRYYENNLIKDVNHYDYNDILLARSEFKYDDRRRLTKVIQKIDATNDANTVYDYNDSGFVYDGNEYQIKITDANNKVTYIALDGFGRAIRTLYPSLDYEDLWYNGDGTLATRTVFNSAGDPCYINYYYDGYGRLKDVNYPDGNNISYSYDGFGRKTLVVDNRNTSDRIGGTNQISYEYDVLDRIAKVNDQDYYKITYTYRADGQKESITVKEPSDANIYEVKYYYDSAGRLTDVNEPNDLVAKFEYDKNGNRKKLKYCLNGTSDGNTMSIDYSYNLDNLLTGFSTSSVGVTGPAFELTDVNVDGLGRLNDANETITNTSQNPVSHVLKYEYDMLSELTDANISNIDSNDWVAEYVYKENGDMVSRTINSAYETFDYNGHQMTDANGNSLSWDKNGQMTVGVDVNIIWNWDGKLRSADSGGDTISVKYDPSGNRIFKNSSVSGARKYIVDIVGDLPVILLEIDDSNDVVKKTYIYANSQVLAQHDGNDNDPLYFYLHDRLGSVRQVIDSDANVVNLYTYEPFGQTIEDEGTLSNPFIFAGQYYDNEIDQYYLRARQYNPYIGRFTSRDTIKGSYERPLSLHVYLYCENDPLNNIDLNGLWKDGIRYILRELGVANAFSLSDYEIMTNPAYREIWNSTWHGHSDFGYLQGDFDYTKLDYLWYTRPDRPWAWLLGTGWMHFSSLKGAEFNVHLALRSGNKEFFELAMHMGQDYFSHRGRGYGPISHLFSGNWTRGADNPYIGGAYATGGTDREKLANLNRYYRKANKWTKQFEEVWYLIWDTDKWLSLP